MTTEVTVRKPWPDETARVEHFLRSAFLFDSDPFLLVAVTGRVERFVGAMSLSARPLAQLKSSWLSMRLQNENPIGPELVFRGIEEAWRKGTSAIYFAQTVRDGSFAEQSLRSAGFENSAVHEVYEMDSLALYERIKRIYERMRTRNMIPGDAALITLHQTLVPRVRKFLRETLPGSASTLAHETAGYKAEQSLVLLQNGEVKGVLLGRRRGPIGHTGLRVIAKELQGGSGWPNILLMHASLSSGLQTGLRTTRFEFDPELHHDTQQFAKLHGARLVSRRLLLKIDNPQKKS